MNWMFVPGILLYFLIGWFLADACSEGKDDVKMLVFITWPLIAAMFVIVTVTFLIIGLVHVVIGLIFGFKEDD